MPHKLADSVVKVEVQAPLNGQWSPEQISATLAKRDDGLRISGESIYRGIYNPLIPLP
jgi:IS30 family transposase